MISVKLWLEPESLQLLQRWADSSPRESPRECQTTNFNTHDSSGGGSGSEKAERIWPIVVKFLSMLLLLLLLLSLFKSAAVVQPTCVCVCVTHHYSSGNFHGLVRHVSIGQLPHLLPPSPPPLVACCQQERPRSALLTLITGAQTHLAAGLAHLLRHLRALQQQQQPAPVRVQTANLTLEAADAAAASASDLFGSHTYRFRSFFFFERGKK